MNLVSDTYLMHRLSTICTVNVTAQMPALSLILWTDKQITPSIRDHKLIQVIKMPRNAFIGREGTGLLIYLVKIGSKYVRMSLSPFFA